MKINTQGNSDLKYRRFILLLCLMAAVRVFTYTSAFPFFTNMDEWAHFDMVIKYSRGHIPRSIETVSGESAKYIVTYNSPEYSLSTDSISKMPPLIPLWKQDTTGNSKMISDAVALWQCIPNHESTQPPLYYICAGLWANIARLTGITGLWFLYWLRFLNIFIAAACVWVAFIASRRIFPDLRFVWLGVPMMMAFLPQDAFYSIQSDVLSPLTFGIAFAAMTLFFRADVPLKRYALTAGMAMAATLLVKSSNLVLLAVIIPALLYKSYHLIKKHQFKASLLSIIIFLASMLVPLFVWFIWNYSNSGDFTGSESHIKLMGWTYKNFSEIFHHPIFTLKGAMVFCILLMSSFWRGELVWNYQQLGLAASDSFFWITSLLFVIIAIATTYRIQQKFQRKMNLFALLCFISLVGFLVFLSVRFHFGNCFYPSEIFPFFVSGRHISAAMIPFLILYVQGVTRIFSPVKNTDIRLLILLIIIIFISISEIILTRNVFSSSFNLYHY